MTISIGTREYRESATTFGIGSDALQVIEKNHQGRNNALALTTDDSNRDAGWKFGPENDDQWSKFKNNEMTERLSNQMNRGWWIRESSLCEAQQRYPSVAVYWTPGELQARLGEEPLTVERPL